MQPNEATGAMLALESVCVDYGAVKAVQSVSLEVREGEVVALLGPNGAGKTSLLSAVMGIVPVASGTVRFQGRDVTSASPEEKVRMGIGISPEGRRIFANLTVAENLRLGASSQPDKAVRDQLRDRYLEMFPILKERLHQKAGTLSGGEQQQLAISRCLMAGPRIVMLDEPSLGLAPVIVERIFDLIAELKAARLTILLVEQNANEALAVADRAYLMHSGRLRFEGAAGELLESEDLMSHYMGIAEAH
jgi:branched-chain amino acid transport system ATP-binding protein